MNRVVGSGRLSEVIGRGGLEVDKTVRIMGLERISKLIVENTPEELWWPCDAYSDGINTAVKNMKMLPLEFQITGAKWEPWTYKDSVLTSKFMQFLTAYDSHYEIMRDYLLNVFEENIEMVEWLIPFRK